MFKIKNLQKYSVVQWQKFLEEQNYTDMVEYSKTKGHSGSSFACAIFFTYANHNLLEFSVENQKKFWTHCNNPGEIVELFLNDNYLIGVNNLYSLFLNNRKAFDDTKYQPALAYSFRSFCKKREEYLAGIWNYTPSQINNYDNKKLLNEWGIYKNKILSILEKAVQENKNNPDFKNCLDMFEAIHQQESMSIGQVVETQEKIKMGIL